MKKIIASIMGIAFVITMVGFMIVNQEDHSKDMFYTMDDPEVAMEMAAAKVFEDEKDGYEIISVELTNDNEHLVNGDEAARFRICTTDGSDWRIAYSFKELAHYC